MASKPFFTRSRQSDTFFERLNGSNKMAKKNSHFFQNDFFRPRNRLYWVPLSAPEPNKSVIYCTIAPKLDFSCPAKGSTQVYKQIIPTFLQTKYT